MLYRKELADTDNTSYQTELYDHTQKVQYRIGGRDETLLLNVKIGLTLRYNYGDEKCLKVVVTDEKNPLFLYSTEIDADVYLTLKHKLGLLIDFSLFPRQLLTLLSQCAKNISDADNETDGLPKYILSIEESNSDPYEMVEGRCVLLKIIEVNRFQKVCLIALHMVCGSLSEVNAYMAHNIQQLKVKIENLEKAVRRAEERRARAEDTIKSKELEVERVNVQVDDQLKALKRRHDEDLALLKHDYDEAKIDFERHRFELSRELEEKHRATYTKLEEMLERHKTEIASLKMTKSKLEAELGSKNEGTSKLVADMKILQDEVLKSEDIIVRLETEAKEKNIFVVNLKQRVSHLEKDNEEKEKTIQRFKSLLESTDGKNVQLKTVVKEKMEIIENQKANLATLTKDLFKANEIITKMTKENKQTRAKLNERTKIALQQEKVVKSLEGKLSNVEHQLQERKDLLLKVEEKNAELENQLKSSEETMKAKEETICKQERVIGWLNDLVSNQSAMKKTGIDSGDANKLSHMTLNTDNSKINGLKKVTNKNHTRFK